MSVGLGEAGGEGAPQRAAWGSRPGALSILTLPSCPQGHGRTSPDPSTFPALVVCPPPECWASAPKPLSLSTLSRHSLFSCASQILFFYKLEICGNPASSKSIGAVFPTASPHFMSRCHILVILEIFELFHYYCICYGDLGSVIFDVTIAKRSQLAKGSDDG